MEGEEEEAGESPPSRGAGEAQLSGDAGEEVEEQEEEEEEDEEEGSVAEEEEVERWERHGGEGSGLHAQETPIRSDRDVRFLFPAPLFP